MYTVLHYETVNSQILAALKPITFTYFHPILISADTYV